MDRGYRSVVESLPNNSELQPPHSHPHPRASHYILSSQDKKKNMDIIPCGVMHIISEECLGGKNRNCLLSKPGV